jgi:hypothetical protein
MNFSEYYKNYSRLQYSTKNIPQTKKAAESLLVDIYSKKNEWLLIKVKNHINRTGIDSTVDDILNQIVKSDFIASLFCKSTVKQNSSEVCQMSFLKEQRGFDLIKLPSNGNDAWRFILNSGKFIQTSKLEGKTSHSFDFRFNGKYDYFIMAKLTTSQGGGQNQQRQEMLDIIDCMKMYFKENPNSNKRFVLLLDGDSYNGAGIYPFVEKAKLEERILIVNSDTFNAE